MSDCECGWEGHKLHSNTLRAGKVDGDFLFFIRRPRIVTHEAFQSWLEDPLGFTPKNQRTKDQEKYDSDWLGHKDGIIIPTNAEGDGDE